MLGWAMLQAAEVCNEMRAEAQNQVNSTYRTVG
jgi:hypothetical protein